MYDASAVRQQLAFSISRWQTDQANSTIWLTLKPSQSQQRPLVLGVCYIPPDSHHSVQLSQRSAQVRFESLAAHIAQLNSEGHVLLAGDLNARVGAASQPWITELGEGISAQLQNSDITVNGHGRKLMRLCEEAAMVLCTGRTPGDTPAQPSFRARSNTEPSRLDHVLIDCGLFPAVQFSRVDAHRHESDHFPLELQLLLTVPTLPTAPPPPPAPTPTWVCDSSQRGPYAHALLSGPCQALIAGCTAAASAHQHSLSATGSAHLELADAQFRSWWNPRCLMLQSQLRQAKLLWPRSPHVRWLERRYQSHLRHSRSKFNQREVVDFSQLLRTNPRKFWQAARLPNVLLPTELHDPAAWDSFLSKLTAPPAQHATQLPAPHTPQPPAPARSLNQPLTLAEVEVGLQHLHTMADQEPCTATLQSSCAMLSLWPLQMIRHRLICWRLALWCCSMLPSPQGRCPSPGRPPWSPQYSNLAMPQIQPTIGQSQWVSQSAGYTPTSSYSALSHTQSSSSCGLPPKQATGQSLALSILPSPFSMLLTSTDMPTSLCTCVLWTSNQPTIRSSGSFFGACYSAWGCMATCWAQCSPCIMALCCP